MTNVKLILAATLVLTVACGAATPAPTMTPIPTNPPASSATPFPTSSDPLSLALAPGVALKLVRVPAGEFLMGSPSTDSDADAIEEPQHTLYLDEYLIGQYDVTNIQYAAFVQATKRVWSKPVDRDNYPVVNIRWSEAVAFCAWASEVTGRKVQLPSEAQWEKAARGTDGRKYPWGNEAPDISQLNFNNNVMDTTPVGKYSPQGDSPYGVADMAGNVYQWTSSLKRAYPYQPEDGRENLQSRDWRIVRGGSFVVGRNSVRSANRIAYDPVSRNDGVGFRALVLP
jgi:serine/threonine-protein kinase